MMGSVKNRCVFDTDNPCDSDGFYRYVGRGKTKRMRHGRIRAKEKAFWKADQNY